MRTLCPKTQQPSRRKLYRHKRRGTLILLHTVPRIRPGPTTARQLCRYQPNVVLKQHWQTAEDIGCISEWQPELLAESQRWEVLEQYTKPYEHLILKKGLNMDILKGEKPVPAESQQIYIDLQKILYTTIQPKIFPADVLRQVINLY